MRSCSIAKDLRVGIGAPMHMIRTDQGADILCTKRDTAFVWASLIAVLMTLILIADIGRHFFYNGFSRRQSRIMIDFDFEAANTV